MKTKIYTFFLCICSTLVLQNCVAVLTPTPTPINDEPILTEIPVIIEGTYEINDSDVFRRSPLRIGKQYLDFKIVDDTKLLVKEYYSFTAEDLQNDSISKYYTLKEDMLVYYNETLYKRREELIAKNSKNPESLHANERKELKKLDLKFENGRLNAMFSVQDANKKYEYDVHLLYELDLAKSQLITYAKEGNVETLKAVLKKNENAYFINVFNKKLSRWSSIIIEEKENAISIQIINPKNIYQNKAQYKSLANLQPEQENRQILIDPSKEQFEALLKDPKFLIEIARLHKTQQSVFAFVDDIWLPIIIIIALFLIFLGVRTYKVLKS
ncbi:MAG: hypothetical protein AB8B65_08840 [Kordia sp.]|uniref:hypothetical protein n=1 Tax=Kordia sp. TaxID=1965332 RepID=UPI00385D8BF6